MQFAPQVNLAHVIATIVNHVIAHLDLCQYVRLTPPALALLLWLAREFDSILDPDGVFRHLYFG